MGYIPNNIAAERKRIGWSQEKLATYLGVSTEALDSWEQGDGGVPGEMAVKMARCFSCSTEYLFCLDEKRKPGL